MSLYHTGMSSWIYDPWDLFAGHWISVLVAKDGSFVGKASLEG